MTSTVMLAAVRTILDEATASFWTDAEIYAALADGQNQVIEVLLTMYRQTKDMKYELLSLRNDNTGTSQTVAVPSGFLELLRATFDHDGTGGEEPCEILTHDEALRREDSTFTTATATEPIVYIKSVSDAVTIIFLPTASGTPAFTIHFLKSPTDIASGQNPTLPVTTHSAIVHYAASRMLDKDQRPEEAQSQYGLFLKEIERL